LRQFPRPIYLYTSFLACSYNLECLCPYKLFDGEGERNLQEFYPTRGLMVGTHTPLLFPTYSTLTNGGGLWFWSLILLFSCVPIYFSNSLKAICPGCVVHRSLHLPLIRIHLFFSLFSFHYLYFETHFLRFFTFQDNPSLFFFSCVLSQHSSLPHPSSPFYLLSPFRYLKVTTKASCLPLNTSPNHRPHSLFLPFPLFFLVFPTPSNLYFSPPPCFFLFPLPPSSFFPL